MDDVLASLLLSHAPLKAMIGTDVDWDVARQGVQSAHIVLHLISQPDNYTLNAKVNHFTSRVQFDCFATDALGRRQLVAVLDDFLSGYRGTFKGIRFDGAFKDGSRSHLDTDAARNWFAAQVDYRICWAKA